MSMFPAPPKSDVADEPLHAFSQCHAGILAQLRALSELPALMEAAARARSVADQTQQLFKKGVLEHHAEEEGDLFPAVLKSAHPGEERDRVQAMVERLTMEHRTLEALWKRLEPSMAAGARGKPADIDTAAVTELVRAYSAHAKFEEDHFLPLSQEILGRNGDHMAALGLSLHMRHVPPPAGYI